MLHGSYLLFMLNVQYTAQLQFNPRGACAYNSASLVPWCRLFSTLTSLNVCK